MHARIILVALALMLIFSCKDIGRVLLNLYNNVFYAVSSRASVNAGSNYQPPVSVRTKKISDKVDIIVKDDGTRIPAQMINKIIQPFFTSKPTGQGTGLGLSISYDIVKAHAGQLRVVTKEGEFSEFIIELPVS